MSSQAGASTLPFSPHQRFLHAKTRHSLTVRYVGELPGSNDGVQWIGVEYDDPRHGKGHSGVAKGVQVFQALSATGGAFIKYSGKATPLVPGSTLIDALEDRYGPLAGGEAAAPAAAPETVVLGSSNAAIVVDAPGMDGVLRKIGRLERLREIGFDGEWVAELGGSAEKRALLKERLKNVRALDLSNNLVSNWAAVAEICEHLPSLRSLVINHSRIHIGGLSDKYRAAFTGITELHLGDAAYSWNEAVSVARLFPDLQVLNLNHNALITALGTAADLPQLTTLNLDACPLKEWTDVVAGIASLPLVSLNLTGTLINAIPPAGTPLRLTTLSLSETLIARWGDIDNLAAWVPQLASLRISCAGGGAQPGNPVVNGQLMSGHAKMDRPFVIAKLPALAMLNGTPVSSSERWEAELYYLQTINSLGLSHPAGVWGRYEELSAAHGPAQAPAPPKQTTLKSRLLNIHVIPPSGLSFALKILPSAPVSLLDKKVAKHLKVPAAKVWTARKHDSIVAAWEPVEEMESSRDVGFYLVDGDSVVVVL